MAIYHLHIDSYRRSRGRTAIGGVAYRRGLKAACRVSGKRFNFRTKGEVVFSEFIPAQNDATDYSQLANLLALYEAIEQTEKHPRATLGREIEAALPHELTLPQQVELVRSFVAEVRLKFGAEQAFFDFSIHAKEGNQHVHVCMSEREQTAPFVFKKTKRRDWDGESFVRVCREIWQTQTNFALEKNGINQRVDCRSHADRGLRLVPSLHEGKAAYFDSEVKQMNDTIKQQNQQLQAANDAQAEPQEVIPQIVQPPRYPTEIDDGAYVMECGSIEASHGKPYTDILRGQQYDLALSFDNALLYVNLNDANKAVLIFADASRIEDSGDKLKCLDATPGDAAERLLALAEAKGWGAVSFDGDEAFLRVVFALALKRGMPVIPKWSYQHDLLKELSAGMRPAVDSSKSSVTTPKLPTLGGITNKLKRVGKAVSATTPQKRRRGI